MKKVLVFGTFDKLHEGHISFLEQAKGLGEHLIVCVAQDHTAKQLKGEYPKENIKNRIEIIKKLKLADSIIKGDKRLGNYNIINEKDPQIIALGYDQKELETNLKKWIETNKKQIKLQILKPFNPEVYKSSII